MIITLKITCVAGPYHDRECVRFIEIEDTACLYDLHLAIQNAVSFDEEFEFLFFKSPDHDDSREYIPEWLEPGDFNTEVYEDISVAEALPEKPAEKLYYIFDTRVEWLFEVAREPGEKEPEGDDFYPRLRDELSIGPTPMQYGNDTDSYEPLDPLEEEDDFMRSSYYSDDDEDIYEDEDFDDDDEEPEDEDFDDDNDLSLEALLRGALGSDDEDGDKDFGEDDYGDDEDFRNRRYDFGDDAGFN